MARRPSAHKRGYDAAWRRLRDRLVIERGAKCQECGCAVVLRKAEARAAGGLMQVAHVDHILSIAERPDLRLEPSNLRVLCESCHDRHTINAQGMNKDTGAADRPRSGCDKDGTPIDPKHPWNHE